MSNHLATPVTGVVGEQYVESVGTLHGFGQVAHVDGAEALVSAVFVVHTDYGYFFAVVFDDKIIVS